MRWAIFGLACFAGGFLTHSLQLEQSAQPADPRVCVAPAEVLALRLRVLGLEGALLQIRLRQVELFAQALEVEESCGRLTPAPR
jgi:hypothetical protein